MFSAVKSWIMGGWQQLALGLALVMIVGGAAYIRGHSDGENSVLAGEAKANAQALATFKSETKDMLAKAAADAFTDFKAKIDAMSKIVDQLKHEQEVSHANADALAAAMRGRFTLSPDERVRLECIRRPSDARCNAAGASVPSVRPAVPDQARRSSAPG